MTKKSFFQRSLKGVAIAACLTATTTFAAEKALPTVVYRDYENEPKAKYELTYNNNGRITQVKEYRHYGADYQLSNTRNFEYHRLPNGEFVTTKEEIIFAPDMSDSRRKTSAYDDKGMQLFSKTEFYSAVNSTWVLAYGEQTVVNGSGIRTGIKNYEEGVWTLNTAYTFDSKGRTTSVDEEGSDIKATYVWGNELNELVSATMNRDGNVMIFNNFVPLKNMEYFNAYELVPIFGGNKDNATDNGVGELVPYVWEDYTLHQLMANMNVSAFGQTGTYAWTINDAAGEWTQIFTLGGVEVERKVFKQLLNGGWQRTFTNYDNTYIQSKKYNEYGALIEDYRYSNEDGDVSESKIEYARLYDTQSRPTQTTKTRDGAVDYVETYEAWINVEINTGINTLVVALLAVYPTITQGIVNIENPDNEAISVYGISGVKLLETRTQSIDLSVYPQGLYFIKIGNRTAKVIKQ